MRFYIYIWEMLGLNWELYSLPVSFEEGFGNSVLMCVSRNPLNYRGQC
jgi:hypothetical protein